MPEQADRPPAVSSPTTERGVESAGVALSARGERRGSPCRAAARPDRHASLRGDGRPVTPALRAPRDRLRRPRPRAVKPRSRAPRCIGYEDLAADLGAVLDALGDRARGARRRLDGCPDGGALHARPPRARSGPGDHHAGLRPRRARSVGAARGLGCAGRRAARRRGGRLHHRLRAVPRRTRALPRHAADRAAPATVGTRASRGGGRRPPVPYRARAPSSGSPSWRRSPCRRSWWAAATSPTPSIHSPSPSATRRRFPARGCWWRSADRSPLAWQGGQVSRVLAALAEEAFAADERT